MLAAMSPPADLFELTAPAPAATGDLEWRASRGDRPALESLLRQHAPAVWSVCRALCGTEAARDVAQEALTRVVTQIRRFDPERGTFRSFALAVARNVARDRLRRRSLERGAFARDGEEQVALAQTRGADPESHADARQRVRALEAALSDLPEGMRQALVLFHAHGATYQEIATDLGVPVGTVMAWLHRGRKRLREVIGFQSEQERS